jgi:hypothetical protein
MTVNIPIVNAGLLYVNGLQLARASNTTLTVQAGQARDSSNVNDIIIDSAVTINGAANGFNRLDTGSLANNTWYAVYAIGDSTQNNPAGCQISANTSQPLLPDGYDMYRRIGWTLTDGSAHFLQFYQYGSDEKRNYWWDVGISELSGGAATTFTAINLLSSVPPIATNVRFDITFTPDGATELAEFRPTGSTATNGVVRFGCGVAAAQVGSIVVPCQLVTGAPSVDYKVASGDTLTLLTTGFDDFL